MNEAMARQRLIDATYQLRRRLESTSVAVGADIDALEVRVTDLESDVTDLTSTGASLGTATNALDDRVTLLEAIGEPFKIGAVFISVVSTNPATLLGYGTWSAIGAGRVLVGLDSGDANFDTVEETGGAKTVAISGSISAPTISGSTAAEASHTHAVTAAGTNAAIAATGDAAVAVGTGASNAASRTHTHAAPAFTGSSVTSGAGSSHLHAAGTLAASAPTFTGDATSVVQPYLVVHIFKRTA